MSQRRAESRRLSRGSLVLSQSVGSGTEGKEALGSEVVRRMFIVFGEYFELRRRLIVEMRERDETRGGRDPL